MISVVVNGQKHDLTFDAARTLLVELQAATDASTERTSADTIIAKVAIRFGISMPRLLSRERTEPVAWARQVAMYLLRRDIRPAMSLSKIGAIFGRDHGTVLYSCRVVENTISVDMQRREQVEGLSET